jgi:SAM-dependent methyltransferase
MTEPMHLRTVRAAYDSVAVAYAELFSGALATQPLDRALLAAFAELARTAGAGPVADLGCGPGHVTAYLHSLGVAVFGLDLSPAMVELARRAYPDLRFDVGSMTALDLADGVLSGVVARYSIIHTPPEALPTVFAEFHRVLAPGGHLLLAFQADDEPAEPAEPSAAAGPARAAEPARPFHHKVSLAYRWSPDRLVALLRQAGFREVARLLCEPGETERFPRATLIVRVPVRPRPPDGDGPG